MLFRNLKFFFLIFNSIFFGWIFFGCSKESNPAVPPAPDKDVITTVDRNSPIKIGLLSFTPQKNLFISASKGTFKCYKADMLDPFYTGISGDSVKFVGDEDTIKYVPPGESDETGLATKEVRIEIGDLASDEFVTIGPSKKSLRPYRGKIRLILEGKNLLAVNETILEEYLQGVVPAEMDPTWPEEALKAQAIASRTFALFQIGRYINRGFNLADDDRSQNYGGVSVETQATTNSVIETVNKVVSFEDKLACVVFHKESGGKTSSNLDVWPSSGEIPYLVGVNDKLGFVDFSEGGKFKEWSSLVSLEELKNALNGSGETFVGDYFSSVSLLGLSENGRVQFMDLDGEKNPVVPAMVFIKAVNRKLGGDFIPSNKFTLH
ncbi:MAG: SpoIID/LytB domain-containing protein, partial [bacterium]